MGMNKQTAQDLLGGTPASMAKAIGVSSAAIYQWPDELTDAMHGKVLLALSRMNKKTLHKRSVSKLTAKICAAAHIAD